jgi:hypothetical protein
MLLSLCQISSTYIYGEIFVEDIFYDDMEQRLHEIMVDLEHPSALPSKSIGTL